MFEVVERVGRNTPSNERDGRTEKETQLNTTSFDPQHPFHYII